MKKWFENYRTIETADGVHGDKPLCALVLEVGFTIWNSSFWLQAGCSFTSSSLAIVTLKLNKILDIGWMKDPTWIVNTVEILMARTTKGYDIFRAIKHEIDEVTVKQDFDL